MPEPTAERTADAKTLRETLDKLKDKLKSAAIVLGSVESGKVTLIAGVTSDLTAKIKARPPNTTRTTRRRRGVCRSKSTAEA